MGTAAPQPRRMPETMRCQVLMAKIFAGEWSGIASGGWGAGIEREGMLEMGRRRCGSNGGGERGCWVQKSHRQDACATIMAVRCGAGCPLGFVFGSKAKACTQDACG